jgi:hypothetical protein
VFIEVCNWPRWARAWSDASISSASSLASSVPAASVDGPGVALTASRRPTRRRSALDRQARRSTCPTMSESVRDQASAYSPLCSHERRAGAPEANDHARPRQTQDARSPAQGFAVAPTASAPAQSFDWVARIMDEAISKLVTNQARTRTKATTCAFRLFEFVVMGRFAHPARRFDQPLRSKPRAHTYKGRGSSVKVIGSPLTLIFLHLSSSELSTRARLVRHSRCFAALQVFYFSPFQTL